MPLKLKDLQHPSSTSLINKWADEKEAAIRTLQDQIKRLQDQLNKTK